MFEFGRSIVRGWIFLITQNCETFTWCCEWSRTVVSRNIEDWYMKITPRLRYRRCIRAWIQIESVRICTIETRNVELTRHKRINLEIEIQTLGEWQLRWPGDNYHFCFRTRNLHWQLERPICEFIISFHLWKLEKMQERRKKSRVKIARHFLAVRIISLFAVTIYRIHHLSVCRHSVSRHRICEQSSSTTHTRS